ncbi:MAG: hypothetical protein FWG83_03750 [Oscillospiraceae bacterium]|nr:hypothetical protein [Oscillospiraceae bacterium]
MFNDLQQKGVKEAKKRSICGLISASLFIALFYLNVFGLEENVLKQFQPFALIGCTLIAVASAINWYRASNGSLQKCVEKYAKNNSRNYNDMLADLERVWSEGCDFGAGRMNTEYIIIVQGFGCKIIPLKDAAWAYKAESHGRGEGIALTILYKGGEVKISPFGIKGAAVDAVLSYIKVNIRDIALGNNKEANKLFFAKDWQGLAEYAHSQRVIESKV